MLLNRQKTISLLVTTAGIALLAYMIIVEDEPGAIPLFLVLTGSGWYLIVRHRIRSRHT